MNSYTIEENNNRILVRGSVPVAELSALTKVWADKGMDTFALDVAAKLNVTLAICAESDVDVWCSEVGEG